MNTQKRILHLFSASIREGELHLFLAELSRILVVLIEGRGSALRSSRPVASDESGSRHLRVLSHNELDRRRRRSHRVSSRHRVHLITGGGVGKRTSDGTRGRIHVHSLGKIGTDGELIEIGVRTSRHRLNGHTDVLGHGVESIAQIRGSSNDTNTQLTDVLLETHRVGLGLLGDRGSTHNAHCLEVAVSSVLVRKTHRKLGVETGRTIGSASASDRRDGLVHRGDKVPIITVPVMVIGRSSNH